MMQIKYAPLPLIHRKYFALCVRCNVVGIDEAQGSLKSIVYVADNCGWLGGGVIVAVLDMISGQSFGRFELMAVAEYVSKVHAICEKCGDLANPHTD